MRYSILVALLLTVISCGRSASSGKDVLDDPEVKAALEKVAREQAQGLADASAKIHRAYNYTSGHTWIKPEKNMKVVAVDVEFRGAGDGFDLEDVEIADAATNESHGGDPEIFVLGQDGSYQGIDWPNALGGEAVRMLLLYEVPKGTKAVKLSYWGEEIVGEAVELAPAGPAMPSPQG